MTPKKEEIIREEEEKEMGTADPIKKYFSKLGKKSWKVQKKKKDSAYMRDLQRKSVESRKKNKEKKDVDK